MYFKKLELAGFKSFAEKTTLHFEPGITAVVGPNGCGKSNIFDSIRWCLGEQSIKSLRGGKMEDVIFNGTEKAPPQNVAEVSLTLSNEAKILPIEYDEVTITRRLFRSGESQYLINNNIVRLKDINELLMGTGIGAESYSLVEQGKIDLVISSKPEDRRLVFDEATGVSRYKAKKKEAMKRLEETDNNLLRINDIITEVKRQIGSIERQANKARRYNEVFEKLKNGDLRLSTLELKTLSSEIIMISELGKNSQQEEARINEELQKLDERLMHQKKELTDLDAKLSLLKDEISSLTNSCERNHQHINLNSERIIDLDKHAEMLLSQKGQLNNKILELRNNIALLSEQLMSLHDIFSGKEKELNEKESVLSSVINEVEASQNKIQNFKKNIFDINYSQTQINNEINETSTLIHTLKARQRRLDTEKIKTTEETTSLKNQLDEINAQVNTAQETITQIQKKVEGLNNEKNDLENSLNQKTAALRNFENDKLSLESQIEFLKELKLKYDGMPEAKDGILEINDLPKEKISGVIARAKDVVFNNETNSYRITCEIKFIAFDLTSLENKKEEIQKNIEECLAQINDTRLRLSELEGRLTEERKVLQQEEYGLMNKKATLSNLGDNHKKICDELSLIELELGEVADAITNNTDKETHLKESLAGISTQLHETELGISENQSIIERNAKRKEEMLVEITHLKSDLENQKSKEDSLQANLDFFTNALNESESTLNSNDKEIESSQQKVVELKNEIELLKKEIESNNISIEEKSKEQSRLNAVRIEEVNTLDYTQKQILELEEKIDKIKEDNHRHQMQEQELNFKHSNIKNRVLQTYNIDLDETPCSDEEISSINIEELRSEIATLREKIESFGTVNLVALEELEELKNRYEFLNQQQNDLNLGKDSLQKAIQKINRTTRKMFLETFQIVADHFKDYYKLLFGGGEAQLFLIDEEDVLESGIEIICRPPGKKLQNITLLSGGEKSLSAIALIFAIFKTKPSPFCVLDEIDAALDESNIDRYSRMLGDFSQTSQFIVITHNKKTISRANVMYGITMEQSGMSKIVSVKLHENASSLKDDAAAQKKQLTTEPA